VGVEDPQQIYSDRRRYLNMSSGTATDTSLVNAELVDEEAIVRQMSPRFLEKESDGLDCI
jgi:hypothetical protein